MCSAEGDRQQGTECRRGGEALNLFLLPGPDCGKQGIPSVTAGPIVCLDTLLAQLQAVGISGALPVTSVGACELNTTQATAPGLTGRWLRGEVTGSPVGPGIAGLGSVSFPVAYPAQSELPTQLRVPAGGSAALDGTGLHHKEFMEIF